MQQRTEDASISKRLMLGAIFIALIGIDLTTETVPMLAGFVLFLAYATTVFPTAAIGIMVVVATAVAGIGPLFHERAMTFVSWAAVFNRGAVLTIVVVLVRRFTGQQMKEFRESRHDELTGLPNRRFLLDRLESELNRNRRTKKPLTIAFLDCDHFKAVNDESGHAAGDRVLRQLSDALTKATRDYDLAARWGGDEFVLLLPETDAVQSRTAVARLLDKVESDLRDGGNTMTFSAGVVTVVNVKPSGQDLIRRADEAMYIAKRTPETKIHYVVLEDDPVGAVAE